MANSIPLIYRIARNINIIDIHDLVVGKEYYYSQGLGHEVYRFTRGLDSPNREAIDSDGIQVNGVAVPFGHETINKIVLPGEGIFYQYPNPNTTKRGGSRKSKTRKGKHSARKHRKLRHTRHKCGGR
jgi:hypothetical protein